MATSSLYGNSSESIGLYGIGSASGGTYFEWFIFYDSATAPATPTGGSWSFTTNTGTAPTGWLNAPPASPSNLIWVSIAIVDSRSTAALTWSVPGLMAASGLPILTGSGVPSSGTGVNGQLYINTATTPQSMYNKQSGSWVQITGSNLVDLVNNQTIGGTKTFSSPIVGSVTGTAGNVSGIVAIANGGTNASTASGARTNLGLGTISTQDASSVAITGGSITGITDLAITDGGTGASTATNARTNLGAVGLTDTQTLTNKTISGASNTLTNIGNSSLTNSSVTINGSGISLGGSVTITAATPNNLVFGAGLSATGNFNGSVATNVTLANVGTAATYGSSNIVPVFTTNSFGQIISVSPQTITVDSTDIVGTIAIAQGGTGASSAANARINLLPSYAGNGGKVFALNAGATDVEWRTVSGTGTVSSVDVSGGTTGLTTSGGPITAAGTITIGGTLAVGSGGTGVTTSSGANSVVLRDANSNITTNSVFEGYSSVAAAGTTTVLTASSIPSYVVTGSGGQTFQLPNATTLPLGALFTFNNNQSSGAITVNNASGTLIVSVPSGGYTTVTLLANAVSAGTWDRHDLSPSNVAWSTNTFDYPGSITSATWNGATIATNRGGTGLTSFTSGGAVYATSTSALTTGTLPVASGGTGLTTLTAGYIPFGAGTSAFGSNANLFWDNTNSRLGLGTLSPTQKISIIGASFVGSSFNGQSFGDNAAERLRIGYKNGTPDTGLVPAQIITDTSTLQFASRDNSIGTITFATGTGIPERMRLDSSGNVGIGTSSPSFKLDVTGNIRTSLGAMIQGSSLTATASQVTVDQLNTTTSRLISWGANTSTAGILYLGTLSSDASVGSASALVINASQNVGIGTTSPSQKLSVSVADGVQALSLQGATGRLRVRPYADATNGAIVESTNSAESAYLPLTLIGSNVYTNPDTAAIWKIGGTEGMRLTSTGLGIGTTPATFKLDVLSASNTVAQFYGGTNGYTDFTNGTITARIQTSGYVRFGSATNHDVAFQQNGTEIMRLTSTGLGIGTSSPSYKLDVSRATTGASARFANSTSYGQIFIESAGTNQNAYLTFTPSGTGNAIIQVASGDYLQITSTGNVGIGTSSPSQKLDVVGSINASVNSTVAGVSFSSGTGTALSGFAVNTSAQTIDVDKIVPYHGIAWKTFSDASGNLSMYMQGYNGIRFYTNGSERMRIDASGNLGLGYTPSAWTANSKALQFGNAALWTDNYSGATNTGYNAYQDTNTTFKYLQTGLGAARYEIAQNLHRWYNAPSGTAGNAITWTQAMTLDASGRLLVNSTSSFFTNSKIQVTASAGPSLGVQQTTSTEYAGGFWNTTSTGNLLGFYTGAGGSQIGSITGTSTTLNINGPTAGSGIAIDPSGNVGIGTSSPGLKLDVSFSSAGDGIRSVNTLSTGFADVRVGNNTNASLGFLRVGGSAQGGIYQDSMVVGTGGGYPIKIAPQGTVAATFEINKSVALQGASTATGTGITFPATQSASSDANTLDDYEEGAWTPSVGGTATYTTQEGYYVKVGQLVYLQCKIQILLLGTGSTTTISGMPFTSFASSFTSAGTGGVNYFASLASSVTTLVAGTGASSSSIVFGSLTAAGTSMTAVTTVFGNSARIDFSMVYRAAS